MFVKLAVDGRLAVGEICTVLYRVGNKHCNTLSSSESGVVVVGCFVVVFLFVCLFCLGFFVCFLLFVFLFFFGGG